MNDSGQTATTCLLSLSQLCIDRCLFNSITELFILLVYNDANHMRGTSLVVRRSCYWQPRFPRNHCTVRARHKRQQLGIVMTVTISMVILSVAIASRSAQAILDALEGFLHLKDTILIVLPILLTRALFPFVLAAG